MARLSEGTNQYKNKYVGGTVDGALMMEGGHQAQWRDFLMARLNEGTNQ